MSNGWIPTSPYLQEQLVAFIEETNPEFRSSFWLDTFYRDVRTNDEQLDVRTYSKGSVLPMLYQKSCVPPRLIDPAEESLQQQTLTFPTMKGRVQVTGCDVNEITVNVRGEKIPTGRQRWLNEFNRKMMNMFESHKAAHIVEAITLLKEGGYVLRADPDSETPNLGTIDFNRADELSNIDLTAGLAPYAEDKPWSDPCSRPFKTIESILRAMNKYGAGVGTIDVIYSPLAWDSLEAHEDAKRIRHSQAPFTGSFGAGDDFTNYSDVEFKGQTGRYRHWVDNTSYVDYDGELKQALDPGEIMIVSSTGFGGRRFWRTFTSDHRERLTTGQNYFLYSGLDREYDPECRTYRPWMEEYHLFVPTNVNGACVLRVVDENYEPCAPCEACPE